MPQRTPFLETARWFALHRRPMPWRENPTPYRVWLSETMLQQTTVSAVIPYFQRFIAAYPTLDALACADEQSVLSLWSGLGYYSRARNLLASARAIARENNFPCTYEGLLALKGVGAYTAGAVASIAFRLPVPLVDTNVERVLGRYFALRRGSGFEKDIRARAEVLVKEACALDIDPGLWNQALMEIGSLVCSPKSARCTECPLVPSCAARSLKDPLGYPGDRPKPPLRQVEESVTLHVRGGALILAQNTGKRRQGLWDLPLEAEGKEIGSMGYRISNDAVRRRIFLGAGERPLRQGEAFFNPGGSLPPLTSPARKILGKYENIINKA